MKTIRDQFDMEGSYPMGLEKIILELHNDSDLFILPFDPNTHYNFDSLLKALFGDYLPKELTQNLTISETKKMLRIKSEKNLEIWERIKRFFWSFKGSYLSIYI